MKAAIQTTVVPPNMTAVKHAKGRGEEVERNLAGQQRVEGVKLFEVKTVSGRSVGRSCAGTGASSAPGDQRVR